MFTLVYVDTLIFNLKLFNLLTGQQKCEIERELEFQSSIGAVLSTDKCCTIKSV